MFTSFGQLYIKILHQFYTFSPPPQSKSSFWGSHISKKHYNKNPELTPRGVNSFWGSNSTLDPIVLGGQLVGESYFLKTLHTIP